MGNIIADGLLLPILILALLGFGVPRLMARLLPEGVPALLAHGLRQTLVTFGGLGVMASMIWTPIMVLSVAGLPRKWVHKKW